MNARAWFSFLMTSRWLGFRLDMISSIILVVLLFFASSLKGRIDVGLIGFALVYTLSLAGLFQWAVRQSAEVENQMTSVERINTYSKLEPEEGYKSSLADLNLARDEERISEKPTLLGQIDDKDTGDSNVKTVASRVGHVAINQLTVTYRDDLPPVLSNLTIDIPPGSKVGVCGRTGCGKSSLLQALLRLNIITSGDIIVDGKSLLKMSLEEARTLVSMIPQDPHLFSGTVRFNLDPFNHHSDQEIWSALKDAQIHEYFSTSQLGLSSVVEEGGKNFSVGQRQLLSLARAIVRRGTVVLMDEVTASIDYMTDKAIQETIRTSEALRHATIITVAHRLRTIADSDIIGLIQDGSFVEIGKPYELLLQKQSKFRKLAEESGEMEDILAIAKSKFSAVENRNIENSSSV
jgi:ABC-type multidrug transport system fused ATPase/permease subunit